MLCEYFYTESLFKARRSLESRLPLRLVLKIGLAYLVKICSVCLGRSTLSNCSSKTDSAPVPRTPLTISAEKCSHVKIKIAEKAFVNLINCRPKTREMKVMQLC